MEQTGALIDQNLLHIQSTQLARSYKTVNQSSRNKRRKPLQLKFTKSMQSHLVSKKRLASIKKRQKVSRLPLNLFARTGHLEHELRRFDHGTSHAV